MKPTKGNVFIDTNVLIYLYSTDEPEKRNVAEKLFVQAEKTIISTQVLSEFVNVMYKKKKAPLETLLLVVRELSKNSRVAIIKTTIIEKAIGIASINNYTYFDSLIISSALENDCSLLFTEDMHNNHVIEGALHIKNPFSP